jgi:hypothetical protein
MLEEKIVAKEKVGFFPETRITQIFEKYILELSQTKAFLNADFNLKTPHQD